MEREKILLMGVGMQGQKTVKAVRALGNTNIRKVFVDKQMPEGNLVINGTFVQIPFYLELGSWEPAYPVKAWLSDEKNMHLLENMFQGVKLLVVVCGIGGEQTFVAKELMEYCKKNHSEVEIYFVGSIPFRKQTDYVTNYISRIMIDFLKRIKVAYSVVENECLFHYYEEFQAAYEVSHLYLAQIIDGVLFMTSSKKRSDGNEQVKLPGDFWKRPVYYMEFDVDSRNPEVPLLENPLLPMDFVKDTGVAEIYLRSRLEQQQVNVLLELHDLIERQIGDIECFYYEGKDKEKDSSGWCV